MTKFKWLLLSILCLFFLNSEAAAPADSVVVTKIWDQGKHNGFPDLLRFKNAFYCALREGNSHMPDNSGKVRIIRSKDGKAWESLALLELEGKDVREARISVTPDGRIMAILAVGNYAEGKYQVLYPMVAFSDKAGTKFSPLEKVTIDPAITPAIDWLWRVTWHKGTGYGIVYQNKPEGWEIYLLKTKDGKKYEKVSQLKVEGRPNESTVRVDANGRMYVLVRREAGDKLGVLAESSAPYKDWTFNPLKYRLGGPNFLFFEDKLVVGTRYFESNKTSTALLVTDLKGAVLKTIKLPSGGDTSYPGMLFYKDKLWVVYYSSHEEKTNIYFTQIPEKDLK